MRVLLAGDEAAIPVHVSEKPVPTVADLYEAILSAVKILPPQRLRIIVEGRLIASTESKPLVSAGINDGCVVHCGISDPPDAGALLDLGSHRRAAEEGGSYFSYDSSEEERHSGREEVPETSMSMLLSAPPIEFGQDAGPSIEEVQGMVGNWSDWISGALLGLGLGLIMLLLTTDTTISFSKQFKAGIRMGVLFNFMVGVIVVATDSDLL